MDKKLVLTIIRTSAASALMLAVLLAIHFFSVGGTYFDISMGQIIIFSITVLIMVNIIYLYHLTRRAYGPEHSDDFFNFPVNFLVSMMTVVMVYQIGFDSMHSAFIEKRHNDHDLSTIAEKIVVGTWEGNPFIYPQLNNLYEGIMGHQVTADGTVRFRNRQEWQAIHPGLKYFEFKHHALSWHYAAEFCQQMVNVIRMFELQKRFKLGDGNDLDMSLNSNFSGWLTGFRMFLKNPLVRQVWETNKTRYSDPQLTAWVQYYVIDLVDRDPDLFIKHRRHWDREVAALLNRPEMGRGIE